MGKYFLTISKSAIQPIILIFLFFFHTTAFAQVFINELDSDTAGSDTLEFIELFDGGRGHTSLDSLVLVFYNGSTNKSYKTFDLDGWNTNADGYFVLGNPAVENVDLQFPNGTLQNGADAVALYFGRSADFPNGTPLTTENLVDAIVYDTNDADDPELLTLLNTGQPQVNEDDAGDKDHHSAQRLPNGTGGARNTESYTALLPTPGIENTESTPLQWTLTASVTPAGSGTVTANPQKVTYNNGEIVFLTAENKEGFDFTHWSGDIDNEDSTASTISITMDKNRHVEANFKETVSVQWTLTSVISPEETGSITRNPDKPFYNDSEAVQLIANPKVGFVFSNWTGDLDKQDSRTPTISLIMNQNKTVTAHFAARTTPLLINELDADTPGSDKMEFIELFDGGNGNTALNNFVIVLFNGSTDKSYNAFDLDSVSTNADGYFVLGNAAVENVDLQFPNGTLQNGADAVALYFGHSVDFPNGTPLTTENLVDAIVYDTNDADDPDLLTLLNSGQPQVNEDGAGDKDHHSLQRLPNGAGGPRNTESSTALPPTPGTENIEPPKFPDLVIEPASLDFGKVEVGLELDLLLTVRNAGENDLTIDSTEIVGRDADVWFLTKKKAPFTLKPGEKTEITVCFNPDSAGFKQAALRVESNDPDTPALLIPLTGEASAPDIAAIPEEVKFWHVETGSLREQTFELLNSGTSTLKVSQTTLHGSNTDQYEVENATAPFELSPNESRRIIVRFHPDSPGAKHAHLRLFSNDPDENPFNVVFSGTGIGDSLAPQIAIDTKKLDFGDVKIGSEQDLNLIIKNMGTADLEILKTELLGATIHQWQITNGHAPFTIQPDSVKHLTVCFSPTSPGLHQAQLSIESNDSKQPTILVDLLGNGITTTLRDTSIVINEIHYNPSTQQGSDTDFEFLELFNRSDRDIDLTGLAFCKGINYTFQQTAKIPANGFLVLAKNAETYPGSIQWTSGNLNNKGETICLRNPDGAIIDSVEYSPKTPWPVDANGKGPSLELKLPSLDNSLPENWQSSFVFGGTPGRENSKPDSTLAVPKIVVTPSKYDFGILNKDTPDSCSLTIFNQGKSDLLISEITVTGEDRQHFFVRHIATPITLVPTDSVSFNVNVISNLSGKNLSDLQITSSDPETTIEKIPLTVYINSAPQIPVLLSPIEGESADTFIWRSSKDFDSGDSTFYMVQISADSQFVDILAEHQTLTDTTLSMSEIDQNINWQQGAIYYWRGRASDNHEAYSAYTKIASFQYLNSNVTNLNQPDQKIPDRFYLAQNYPNPFNPQTTIRYKLAETAQISLQIFDVRGRLVSSLQHEKLHEAGEFSVKWNGKNDSGQLAASGIYFYILAIKPVGLKGASVRFSKKMTLLK